MRVLIQDIEANGLDPDTIHVICTKLKGSDEVLTFTDMNEYFDYIIDIRPHKHVFHNGLGYDVPVINRLVSPGLIDPKDVIDTMVVSKLLNYKKYNKHSLDEIGTSLGFPKTEYTGGWDECTSEMISYCQDDVLVLSAILDDQWKYITDPAWAPAMRTEHDMAWLCYEMGDTGFKFDKSLATGMLEDVTHEMDELEASFRVSFPPQLVEVTRNKMRYTEDGTLYANITKNIAKYPKAEVEGKEIVFYDYKEFNPGSSKNRVDALWDAGWQPFDKTDGHKKHLRSKMKWRK